MIAAGPHLLIAMLGGMVIIYAGLTGSLPWFILGTIWPAWERFQHRTHVVKSPEVRGNQSLHSMATCMPRRSTVVSGQLSADRAAPEKIYRCTPDHDDS